MKKVEIVICKRCVMDTTDPDITFDENAGYVIIVIDILMFIKKYPMLDDASRETIH